MRQQALVCFFFQLSILFVTYFDDYLCITVSIDFPTNLQEGFWYHHAEPKYLMLVYWIPETVHTLPVNASHRVGVGGFVMNDKREVPPLCH